MIRIRTRTGAALVLALVILAALMMLGLPFLFSQSSSLAGARYLAAGQAARLYADSARNLGIATAIYAHEFSQVDDITLGTNVRSSWTAWIPSLADYPATKPVEQRLLAAITTYYDADRNTVQLQPEALYGDWNKPSSSGPARSLIGVRLSDEYGKLDINSLGPVAWDALIRAVLGPNADPDDTQISAANRRAAGYQTGNPLTLYEDGNPLGQLSEGLVYERMKGPYRSLEDLLKVEPYLAYGSILGNGHRIARRPLNRAELDLLRPYLTVHTLGQAAGGVIDLCNVVDNQTSTLVDDLPHHQRQLLVGKDTWLENKAREGGALYENGTSYTIRYRGWSAGSTASSFAARDEGLWLRIPPTLNANTLSIGMRGLVPGTPIPPGSYANPLPFQNFGTLRSVVPTGLGPIYDPTGQKREWPALSIASLGVVGIEASASIFDPAGNPLADSRTRSVVQTVPQEGLIEKGWLTQGQIDTLVRARMTSQMVSWPVAINRDTAQTIDDPPVGTLPGPKPGTGLATETQVDQGYFPPALTNVPTDWAWTLGGDQAKSGAAVLNPTAGFLATGTGLNDYAAVKDDLRPDGLLIKPTTQVAVALEGPNGGNGPLRPLAGNEPESAPRHLSFWFQPQTDWASGDPIVLAEARLSDINAGKQHIAGIKDADAAAPGPSDVAGQNYWSVAYLPEDNVLALISAGPAIPWTQNTQNEPAVFDDWNTPAINEASLGVLPDSVLVRWLNPPTRTTTRELSDLWIANRVMHLYYFAANDTPKARQWYRVTVGYGIPRPGGLSLAVDGNYGRDVTTNVVAPSDGWKTGDQCTLPAMVLKTALPARNPLISTPVYVPTDLVNQTVELQVPAMATNLGLTAANMLPEGTTGRGAIHVGNETIAYADLEITTDGAKLTQCVRGVRQNTQTDRPSESWMRFPGTQAHAVGALVLPGDVRTRCSSSTYTISPTPVNQTPTRIVGRLYAGGCFLDNPIEGAYGGGFGPGDVTANNPFGGPTFNPVRFQVWGALRNEPDDPEVPINGNGQDIQLTPNLGTTGLWPKHGVVRIFLPGQGRIAYFHYNDRIIAGTSVTLKGLQSAPIAPTTVPPPGIAWTIRGHYPDDLDITYGGSTGEAWVWLVSIPAGGEDPTTDNRYPYPYDPKATVAINDQSSSHPCLLQLTSPFVQNDQKKDGSAEWITYTSIISVTRNNPGTGNSTRQSYFVNSGGWGKFYIGNNNGTNYIARGQQRTIFQAGQLPGPGASTNPSAIQITSAFSPSRIVSETATSIPGYTFPDKTALIPVQTEFSSAGHRLLTGDVVTIIPQAPKAPAIQRTVRMVSTDGLSNLGTTPAEIDRRDRADSYNGYFAFSDHLDKTIDLTAAPGTWVDLVVGTGMSTAMDLSPQGALFAQPSGYRIRLDLLQEGPLDAPIGPGRMMMGNQDTLRSTLQNSQPVCVDAWSAGSYGAAWDQRSQPINGLPSILATLVAGAPNLSYGIDAAFDPSTATTTMTVWASTELFRENLGLVRIDGEVFAYRRATVAEINAMLSKITMLGYDPDPALTYYQTQPNRYAVLIARGLLGTIVSEHKIPTIPTVPPLPEPRPLQVVIAGPTPINTFDRRYPTYTGLSAQTLPIGPVFLLSDGGSTPADQGAQLDGNNWWRLATVDGTGAPVLATNKDSVHASSVLSVWPAMPSAGSDPEVLVAIGPKPDASTTSPAYTDPDAGAWKTPTWLRGLHGTERGSWGGKKAVVIAWWPRFAPALPAGPLPAGPLTDKHYRSRQFSWAAYPLRLHHMQMPPNGLDAFIARLDGHQPPEWTYLIDAVTANQSQAIKHTPEWLNPTDWAQATDTGVLPSTTILFAAGAFLNRSIDGITVRLGWQLAPSSGTTNSLINMANAGNRPVAIGHDINAGGDPIPSQVRLRVHAQATILATDTP